MLLLLVDFTHRVQKTLYSEPKTSGSTVVRLKKEVQQASIILVVSRDECVIPRTYLCTKNSNIPGSGRNTAANTPEPAVLQNQAPCCWVS